MQTAVKISKYVFVITQKHIHSGYIIYEYTDINNSVQI